jgi:hypothetical protein
VKIIRDKRIGALIVAEGEEMVGILSYLDVLDAAERAHDETKPRHPGPGDTQSLTMQEIRVLRQQMADELSEFRTSTQTPKKNSVDRQARAARLAEQESRRLSQAKERSDATQEIMNDIRSQLDEDD